MKIKEIICKRIFVIIGYVVLIYATVISFTFSGWGWHSILLTFASIISTKMAIDIFIEKAYDEYIKKKMELNNQLSLMEKGIEEKQKLQNKYKLYSDLAAGNEKRKQFLKILKKVMNNCKQY